MQLCWKPRGARGFGPETFLRRGQLLSRPPTTGLFVLVCVSRIHGGPAFAMAAPPRTSAGLAVRYAWSESLAARLWGLDHRNCMATWESQTVYILCHGMDLRWHERACATSVALCHFWQDTAAARTELACAALASLCVISVHKNVTRLAVAQPRHVKKKIQIAT